jgi:hypothetical protein
MGIEFESVPVGSLIRMPSERRIGYWEIILKLPKQAKEMLHSWNTGAYIRGLTKQHGLNTDKSQIIALIVVRVVIGELKVSNMAAALSADLPLPNDKAQVLASEIEKELLEPVRAELEEFWAQRHKQEPAAEAERRAGEGGAKNVLNLKEEKNPPSPPWREG